MKSWRYIPELSQKVGKEELLMTEKEKVCQMSAEKESCFREAEQIWSHLDERIQKQACFYLEERAPMMISAQ